MKIKRIYWFSHYNLNSPSVRYRGKYAVDFLKKNTEIDCNFIYPERSLKTILTFIKLILSALFYKKSTSIVVIQKVCSNNFYANTLKLLVILRPKNIVYDWDDAEYVRQDTKTLHFFLSNCKVITVGSSALKEYSEKFNSNVILNTTPVLEHSATKRRKNKILNIGWVGDIGHGKEKNQDFTHRNNLFTILFPEIKKIHRPCKLTLIGIKNESDIPLIKNHFKDNPNIDVIIPTNLNWKDDRWIYNEISKFDIGVSPLNSHPFNVAKSAFKVKQYLSVGIPTLASDVGENKKFVLNNTNGFICTENDDFFKGILKIDKMSHEEYTNFIKAGISNKMSYTMDKYITTLLDSVI